MPQLTLATTGFDRYAKTTRRAAFLCEMDQVAPWPELEAPQAFAQGVVDVDAD